MPQFGVSCGVLRVGNASDDLYCSSGAGRLNAFGIGAFALRHRPGEVPAILRKLRVKAGWSVNPTSNATVSKESLECNKRDFGASTRLKSKYPGAETQNHLLKARRNPPADSAHSFARSAIARSPSRCSFNTSIARSCFELYHPPVTTSGGWLRPWYVR